jgi:predicted nucleic acid-binding protein
LGELAFQFFKLCGAMHHEVLYSKLVRTELRKYYPDEKIDFIFKNISEICTLHEVELKKENVAEAFDVSRRFNVPQADALHAILARNNCAILISTDNHFEHLSEIAESLKPWEVT